MFYKKGDQATVMRDSYAHDFRPGTAIIILEVNEDTKTYLAFRKGSHPLDTRYVPQRDLHIVPQSNSQAQHLLTDIY